ncbi:uncharacterized protein LOC130511600 [Raphanus sativus]|uniref:Uncharacterized protein LOC130511600 n=1 Tax=Raphanus sativus TaxID=3726 RepID=A0A9W3DLY0_RAPSA|nr:uncharacterized protein LOC130511600 [Raphanus sativus]
MDPRDTLQLAETESKLWVEAQILPTPATDRQQPSLPSIPGRWCFLDGSLKDNEVFSGQGWYSTLEGFTGLMRARNIRASLSPFHSEVEALLWAMEDIKILQENFYSSEIIHVLRMQNLKADSLARCARKQTFFVMHMDAELPVWFKKYI